MHILTRIRNRRSNEVCNEYTGKKTHDLGQLTNKKMTLHDKLPTALKINDSIVNANMKKVHPRCKAQNTPGDIPQRKILVYTRDSSKHRLGSPLESL